MIERTRPVAGSGATCADGFSLAELLIAMSVLLIILASTGWAMTHAIRANRLATLVTGMNANLRTGMDIMVRDLLQTGQDLPVGRVILIPSGVDASPIRLPGPPGTSSLVAPGTTELTAVIPGPGRGPTVNGVPTDMITVLAADSSFSNMDLTAITNTSMTVALPAAGISGADISNGGSDDIAPGQLIMLTKGSLSTLVQVTAVDGVQTVTFGAADSLLLNQTLAAAGTLTALNAAAPANSATQTQASRIRMISYYLDVTRANRPRLVRRMNNGHPTVYDNDKLGTVVAFDIENLQITYDIADGVNNPANVRMAAADMLATGPCAPTPCSANQIRKVNILLVGRSNSRFEPLQQFLHTSLASQVSLRSLSFVDKYTSVL
jgi:prepilin-type N-terminal cleavage/methylation domain-containing protein